LMLGQGKQAAIQFLREKPDVAKKITEEIMVKNKKSPTPVEVGVENQAKDLEKSNGQL
jgi:hypothetical protein